MERSGNQAAIGEESVTLEKIREIVREAVGAMPSTEWVSLAKAERMFGIPVKEIMGDIQNGRLGFRKAGTHYKINIETAREYYKKLDAANMEQVKSRIAATPMRRNKVTKDIDNCFRVNPALANPNIKRVAE